MQCFQLLLYFKLINQKVEKMKKQKISKKIVKYIKNKEKDTKKIEK